jgi:hypothetical protein
MRRSLLLIATVCAALLGGCKSSESPIFFTNLNPPYPDVPIPASFTLTGPAANGRYAECLYQSTDALQPVMDFFNKQLPPLGWVPQPQSQSAGRALLRYTKGGDMLQIDISSGTMIRTNISLRISPAPSGGAATQG